MCCEIKKTRMPKTDSSPPRHKDLKHTGLLLKVLIKKVSTWTKKGSTCKQALARLVAEEPELLQDDNLLQVIYNACCEDAGAPHCDSPYESPADSQNSDPSPDSSDDDSAWDEPPLKKSKPPASSSRSK